MEGNIRIVKSLEDSGLLLKGFNETIQCEVKEKKGRFLSMLVGASLLGNILAGTKVIIARYEAATEKQGKGIVRELAMDIKYLQSKKVFNAASSFN